MHSRPHAASIKPFINVSYRAQPRVWKEEKKNVIILCCPITNQHSFFNKWISLVAISDADFNTKMTCRSRFWFVFKLTCLRLCLIDFSAFFHCIYNLHASGRWQSIYLGHFELSCTEQINRLLSQTKIKWRNNWLPCNSKQHNIRTNSESNKFVM